MSEANEARDWRIYAELAQRLIVQARRLYSHAPGITPTSYAGSASGMPETGKGLVFLTNQVTLPALTICAVYKSR
jgi:hypothetical protein